MGTGGSSARLSRVLSSSLIGTLTAAAIDEEDALAFSVLTKVRPMVETAPLKHAADAYAQMMEGRAQFRMVLTIRTGDQGGTVNLEGACKHIRDVAKVSYAVRRECEDCVKTGGQWVQLRTCQTCGGTRCCDSSPNQHASRHAKSAGHPVICSAEPGERWLYCFPHDNAVEY